MGMKRFLAGTTALLATASLVMAAAPPAQAAASGLPETRLRLESVQLVPRTGTIVVTARTRCEGKGEMRWEAQVSQQGKRDRAAQNVPCDGAWRTQQLRLQPNTGRFHAGTVSVAYGDIVCGRDVCIGALIGTRVRLLPHRPVNPFRN